MSLTARARSAGKPISRSLAVQRLTRPLSAAIASAARGAGGLKPLAVLCLVGALVGGLLVPAIASAQTAPPPMSSLIVKLVAALTPAQQASVISRNGGIEVSTIPALRLHVISIPTADLAATLASYQADPRVQSAEENKTRQSETMPTDPLYPDQWYLPQVKWDLAFGTVAPTGTATVAILDTGIDNSHPDLGSNVLPGTSILDSSNGLSDPNGHGTWMAGIVAAQTNTIAPEGIAGVAYAGVRMMPVTVLDSNGLGQDSDVIAGVIWAADRGADVILMGFSNPGFSPNLQDAIDYAWSKGVILVAATGNNASNTPSFPAGDRGVMGVSATDATDSLAGFSNYGQAAFLAAPGINIQTTDLGWSYTVMGGTSASSAVAAGVAAFLKAVDPTLTNGIIVGRIARTADPAGTQEQTGNGRVNMARALADTGTAFIEPAGADPVGAGGPFVGPYVAANKNLVITFAGTDGGTITGSTTNGSLPSPFSCTNPPNSCSTALDNNYAGTLSVASNVNSFFSGWTGSFTSGATTTCTGTTSPCSFSMSNAAQALTATFTSKRNTTTSVSCTPASLPVNGSTNCTATVIDTASGSPTTPTGTVTFSSDGSGSFTPTTSCSLSGAGNTATCSVNFSPSATGTQHINASYAGDTQHLSSATTTPSTLTVTTRATTTAVSCTSPITVAQGTTCTATVTDNAGSGASTPTGTVTLSSDAAGSFSNPGTSCTLGSPTSNSASCTATYTPSSAAASTHHIGASYGGSPVHTASTATAFNLTVNKRATTTAVSLSPSSVVVAQGSTATVTVTDVDANGTKSNPGVGTTVTVTSSDAGDTITGTCTLAASSTDKATCAVTVTPTSGVTGTHNVTATFAATAVHQASNNSPGQALTVTKRTTTTTVSLNPTAVDVNQVSTATLTVTDVEPNGTKSNPGVGTAVTVTSSDAGDTISGMCTLAASSTDKATCQVTVTPTSGATSPHNITASFAATKVHKASDNSPGQPLTVTKRLTTTSVSLSPATVDVNQSTTVNVTVTDIDANGTKVTPTGTVGISVGVGSDVVTGACLLAQSVLGTATCQVTVTPAQASGTHDITATFTATDVHSGSADTKALTVNTRATSTSVSLSPATVVTGQYSTVGVTVTDADTNGTKETPTGTVAISVGVGTDAVSGTCTLNETTTGTATCSVTVTPAHAPGTHTITATFAATVIHSGSADTQTLIVDRADTTTAITNAAALQATVTPIGQAYTVQWSVAVTPPGVGTPTGTVTVSDGTDSCSAAMATGQCSLTSTTTGFPKTLTATYSGDTDFNGSAASTTHIVDTPPAPEGDWYVVVKDQALVVNAPGVLGNDADLDAQSLTVAPGSVVTFDTPTAHGTLHFLHADGSFSYTPNSGFTGTDSFSYATTDGELTSSTVTVTIAVVDATATPVAEDDAYSATKNVALTVVAPGVLDNDQHVVGHTLTAVLDSGPAHGTLTLDPDGSFTYTPNADFTGADSFTYHVHDPAGTPVNSNVAMVTIAVRAANASPAAVNQAYTTDENTLLAVSGPGVLTNATGTTPLSALLVSGPVYGTLTLNADGTFTYTPNTGFSGRDSFIYRVQDGIGAFSNQALVTLTVRGDTSTTLSSSVNPSVYGQSATFTADLTPNTATGTVQFTIDTADFGTTKPLAAGSATSDATSTLTVGTHAIAALYSGDPDFVGSTGTLTQTVTTRATTTTVALAPATVVVGQSSTVTVTVKDTETAGGGPFTPTGTVGITVGVGTDAISGTCVLAGGGDTATCQVTVTPTHASGTHSVTANFSVTSIHSASTGSATLTVQPRTTSTSVALSPDTVVVGQPSSVTVTVTDTAGAGAATTPAGTVAITLGVASDGPASCTLAAVNATTATCQFTVTPHQLSGTHSVAAAYTATDDVHSGSTGSNTLTVQPRTTSTSVALSPDTVVVGQPSSVTVTITDTAGVGSTTPGGTVALTLGVASDGPASCTLAAVNATTATCQFTVTPHQLSGTHSVAVAYTATDDVHSGSTGSNTLTVQPRTTSTSVALTPDTVVVGQPSSVTVTVADTAGAGSTTPAGTVALTLGVASDGPASCTLAAVDATTASCSFSVTPHVFAGTHSVAAAFTATDDVHSGSDGGATLTVNRAATSTGIGAPTVTYNANGLVTVTVTGSSAAGTPSGNLSLVVDGGQPLIQALDQNGSTVFTLTSPGVGNHNLTASFDAQGNFDTSSATGQLLVQDTTPPDTNITGGPGQGSLSNDRNPSFTFSGTDDWSTPAHLTFECQLDNAGFLPCTSPASYTTVQDGAHTFSVQAKDEAGNVGPTPPATRTWTVDATPPDTSIQTGPPALVASHNATFAFSGTDNYTPSLSLITFACSVDSGAFQPCASGVSYTLSDGDHTFAVQAKDAAGNVDLSPATWAWTVDTTAPNTVIESAPASPTKSTTASFTFHGTDLVGDTFLCSLDGAPTALCTSPTTYTNLSQGSHTFSVAGRDSLGNLDATPATYTWTIGRVEIETSMVDADFNHFEGFDMVFGKGTGTNLMIKNTNPGTFHYQVKLTNNTSTAIDPAHGNVATAIITVPGMPSSCGGVACSSQIGALGDPAFTLRSQKGLHVVPGGRGDDDHDDDDDLPIALQYMTLAQYHANGDSCADNGGYTSARPTGGVAKCIKVTGFAIPVKQGARIRINFEFRPKGTDGWSPSANLAFFAGFPFHTDTTVIFPSVVQAASDTAGIVGAGSQVTAIGGFVFNPAGTPGGGNIVRVFNRTADASCTDNTKLVAQDVVDSGSGFYFVWRTGTDQHNVTAPSLPSGVQYAVQVCSPATGQLGLKLTDTRLKDKEFEELDFDLP